MIFFISACSRSTISFGVFDGTIRTCQDTASKSGAPAASENGGTSGSSGSRADDETASARSLPSLISRDRRAGFDEAQSATWPATRSATDCPVLRYGTWVASKSNRCLANSIERCWKRARADRRVIERRVGLLGVGDELRHGLGRQVGIHHQDQRRFHIERNRHEIVFGAVVDLLVERLIDRQRAAGQHDQRVAVRRRLVRPASPPAWSRRRACSRPPPPCRAPPTAFRHRAAPARPCRCRRRSTRRW